MSKRSLALVAVFWVFSLLAVASFVRAQAYAINPVPPRVLSGPDMGIRVEGEQNGVPVGVPVVRIDGQWVEVKFGSAKSAKPITH